MNNVATHALNWSCFCSLAVLLRLVAVQIYDVLAGGSQARTKRLLRISGVISLTLLVLLVTGCGKPDYPSKPRPTLHTTISADGQMVATLVNAGTDKQRLRVMRLDKGEQWEEVKAPQRTQSIQFGLTGHQLLLTHYLSELKQDRLVKVDLDTQDKTLQTLYQYDDIAFPLEVSPGQVMFRTCPDKNKPGAHQCRMVGYRWQMVGPDGTTVQVGPNTIGGFSQPNVVGTGVFWIEDQMSYRKEPHPLIMAYPLPGGEAPVFPRERLEKNTAHVRCDRSGQRCLRKYISNYDAKGGAQFIYDLEVLFGREQCKLVGVAGSADGVSITPDGKAAVMALGAGYEKPRHVVVMRFEPSKCQARAIQHFEFKGD